MKASPLYRRRRRLLFPCEARMLLDQRGAGYELFHKTVRVFVSTHPVVFKRVVVGIVEAPTP